MQLRGKLSSFVIMFQPDGLRRLFSLPMQELTDTGAESHSVLGPWISQLWQVLGNLASFEKTSAGRKRSSFESGCAVGCRERDLESCSLCCAGRRLQRSETACGLDGFESASFHPTFY